MSFIEYYFEHPKKFNSCMNVILLNSIVFYLYTAFNNYIASWRFTAMSIHEQQFRSFFPAVCEHQNEPLFFFLLLLNEVV